MSGNVELIGGNNVVGAATGSTLVISGVVTAGLNNTNRLIKVGLDVRDPKLMKLATDARNAMHALGVELHYQSCGNGVGRPPVDGK